MNPLLIPLSLLLFLSLSSQAQPNYTLLKNGEKVYSSHLRLRYNAQSDQYLMLDSNQHIPIENVDRFHSSQGTFVTIPGSAGTDIYRVEREGPRISLYSKIIYDPYHQADSSITPTREFFFRKAEQENMKIVTFPGLHDAMADNPASLQQLQASKTNLIVGLITMIGSGLMEGAGLYLTAKGKTHQLASQSSYPYNPNQPQLPPQSVTTHPVSPLVYIGAGGVIGGFVMILGTKHHVTKALDLYNQ